MHPKGPLTVPCEAAPHVRTWMCWASTPSPYGGSTGYFEEVQEALGRLAGAIAENEPVMMLAAAEHHDVAGKLCGHKVQLVDVPTDDMWARDSGPVFLTGPGGQRAAVDLNFNGWGAKQAVRHDALVAQAIADHADVPCQKAKVVGEGGGIECDGEGTLILTESCWVNPNRNPGKNKREIEAELKAQLGAEKVIWLPGVRGQDITDGHIDGSVRIIRPGLILTGGYPGDTSEWGAALEEAQAILAASTDAKGRGFEVVDLPSAVDVRSDDPDVFTSYCNFYVGNGAVYTPEFGDGKADARACELLAQLYPGRRIVSLNVDRIYENGGGIHCVTQQEPA